MEEPAWVELLFKRFRGFDYFRNRFTLDSRREHIEELLAQEDGRKESLHSAAVAALDSDDPATVVPALFFLFVVGCESDVALVEPLTNSADEYVEKAARTCLFELTHS